MSESSGSEASVQLKIIYSKSSALIHSHSCLQTHSLASVDNLNHPDRIGPYRHSHFHIHTPTLSLNTLSSSVHRVTGVVSYVYAFYATLPVTCLTKEDYSRDALVFTHKLLLIEDRPRRQQRRQARCDGPAQVHGGPSVHQDVDRLLSGEADLRRRSFDGRCVGELGGFLLELLVDWLADKICVGHAGHQEGGRGSIQDRFERGAAARCPNALVCVWIGATQCERR